MDLGVQDFTKYEKFIKNFTKAAAVQNTSKGRLFKN